MSEANRPYVREHLDEEGKVVIRWFDDVIRMTPAEAAELVVHILGVKTMYRAVDGKNYPDSGNPAIKIEVVDDLDSMWDAGNNTGNRPKPKVDIAEWANSHARQRGLRGIVIHIHRQFRHDGYAAAQRDIRRAIGC